MIRSLKQNSAYMYSAMSLWRQILSKKGIFLKECNISVVKIFFIMCTYNSTRFTSLWGPHMHIIEGFCIWLREKRLRCSKLQVWLIATKGRSTSLHLLVWIHVMFDIMCICSRWGTGSKQKKKKIYVASGNKTSDSSLPNLRLRSLWHKWEMPNSKKKWEIPNCIWFETNRKQNCVANM